MTIKNLLLLTSFIAILAFKSNTPNANYIIYNFGDSVKISLTKNYQVLYEQMKVDAPDSLENYQLIFYLRKVTENVNVINVDWAKKNEEITIRAIESNIYVQLSNGQFVPIITEFDLYYNKKYQVGPGDRYVNFYHGPSIKFNNWGEIITN